jgi:hypothetical protein
LPTVAYDCAACAYRLAQGDRAALQPGASVDRLLNEWPDDPWVPLAVHMPRAEYSELVALARDTSVAEWLLALARAMARLTFSRHEVESIYVDRDEARFIVSLIVGYAPERDGVDNVRDAARAALRLVTAPPDNAGTRWFVHDRKNGRTIGLEQRWFAPECAYDKPPPRDINLGAEPCEEARLARAYDAVELLQEIVPRLQTISTKLLAELERIAERTRIYAAQSA